jgi:hypothetical protein
MDLGAPMNWLESWIDRHEAGYVLRIALELLIGLIIWWGLREAI